MNIAFYISGKSSRLMKYLGQASEDCIKDIKVVFSDYLIEDSLKIMLNSYQIKYCELDYDNIQEGTRKEKNRYISNYMLDLFNSLSIDYCISFGENILIGDILYYYKNRIINFHPSILPMFPGKFAIDKALDFKNVLLVGNTAHFIDDGIDTGPIIMQSVTTLQMFKLEKNYDIILDLQIPMLNKIMVALKNGDIIVDNNNVLINNADYSEYHIYPEYHGI